MFSSNSWSVAPWLKTPGTCGRRPTYQSPSFQYSSRNRIACGITNLVEAAGVEPASEKARREEPTLRIRLEVFGRGRQNRREQPLPSPIDLGLWLRTEAYSLSRKMTLTHRRAGSAAG